MTINTKLLKAFSAIRPGIVLKAGRNIETIDSSGTVYVVANEVSDIDFAIYNISKFLGLISLVDEDSRKITVKDDVMYISDGNTELMYVSDDPEVIDDIPDDTSPLTEAKYYNCFEIMFSDIKRLLQAASLSDASKIKFTFGDGKVVIETVGNFEGDSKFKITLDADVDEEMSITIPKKSINLIDDDYVVCTNENVMRFKGNEATYYIGRAMDD